MTLHYVLQNNINFQYQTPNLLFSFFSEKINIYY